jgi:outer membrane protein TolC
VRAARTAAEQSAAQLGLAGAQRFTQGLEFGLKDDSSSQAPTRRGSEIGMTLPLFDGGDARRSGAEHAYRQALLRAEQTAIDARSEVREAYGAYRSAFDIAKHHRDEIVPLRKRIQDENVLRYNGMLIGVFELLADARVQIASVNAALDAQRDFWLAEADLDMALVGRPVLTAMPAGPAAPAVPAGEAH